MLNIYSRELLKELLQMNHMNQLVKNVGEEEVTDDNLSASNHPKGIIEDR